MRRQLGALASRLARSAAAAPPALVLAAARPHAISDAARNLGSSTPALAISPPPQHPSNTTSTTVPAGTPAAEVAPKAPCEVEAPALERNDLDQQLEQAARERGAEGLLELVDQHGWHMSPQNVLTAWRMLETHAEEAADREEVIRQALAHPALQALVDQVLAGMRLFPPSALTEVVSAAAALDVKRDSSIDMLLDEVGRHLMGEVDELSPADISRLVGSYGKLDHSPGLVLFDALSAKAAKHGGDFDNGQRAAVSGGLRILGYEEKDPFRRET